MILILQFFTAPLNVSITVGGDIMPSMCHSVNSDIIPDMQFLLMVDDTEVPPIDKLCYIYLRIICRRQEWGPGGDKQSRLMDDAFHGIWEKGSEPQTRFSGKSISFHIYIPFPPVSEWVLHVFFLNPKFTS